ncbi:MAG: TonB-dependent receptor plug domain-containing protein [Bacteroidetes bacterium]|nr:TonB-dependent receptor plug domain-containing protein [Bacteroidota bacterium]
MRNLFIYSFLVVFTTFSYAQESSVEGRIVNDLSTFEGIQIVLRNKERIYRTSPNEKGFYEFRDVAPDSYEIFVFSYEHNRFKDKLSVDADQKFLFDITLLAKISEIEEMVVSGTMKEVSKLESAVPVEVYTSDFFKNNPVPSFYDALQNINGVRPQLNCNICSTGDIHINGLEGPYTMILIDGMPIVSGLSTVYGLSGIPQALIDRVEIVKGPASTLYGSEAVGGLINVITKKLEDAPLLAVDLFTTSWLETTADIGTKYKLGEKSSALLGINYFNYQMPRDDNNDGFTDITLQSRISVFNKISFDRKDNKVFTLAGRYVYEDRWGGETSWNRNFRGGDSIYGESIYTNRWEMFGLYELPKMKNLFLQFSANGHYQNSVYGTTNYQAKQYVLFSQLYWNKQVGRNDFTIGVQYRYTYYDDNTVATSQEDSISKIALNRPSGIHLQGFFVQNERDLNEFNKLLIGLRYDFNSIHGSIFSPRLNYKYTTANKRNIFRLGIGNGYRVANVFTEDHAALTGSRSIEFKNELQPETSWNSNLNYVGKLFVRQGVLTADFTAFYTYFSNKIIPDYDTDPNKIIYDNLSEFAISKGLSLNLEANYTFGLKILIGGTLLENYSEEQGIRKNQLFTEKFTGTWTISYEFKNKGITIDYTGNVYSPMRLPLLSVTDPRPEFSPWWSLQNVQLTKKFKSNFEVFGGVKNLLNWTPSKTTNFLLARPNDPFDKQVQFDANGQAMATPNNPYALTFDPTYVYAPNQGLRVFLGFRYLF